MEDSLPPGLQGEKPQEHESWRELYLRPGMPEQRLRVVTANIRAAHENKPQGRQTKMICFNFGGEAPDAPRRRSLQEPLTENGNIKPDPHPRKQPPSLQGGVAAATAASRAP
ncbi:putative elongin-A3 member C [Plecturocebus cupreus]